MQCTTPPSKHPNGATVPITGKYHGDNFSTSSSVVMQFTYTKYSTPVVFYMNPVEAAPGDEVSFVGRWMTTSWDQFDNAKAGTQNMLMFILDSSQTFGSWDTMNLTAVLGDNDQGDLNTTITLNGAYGTAFNRWTGTQYDLNGNPYNFRALARIDSVSASSGSSAGGQELTINGEGFPLNASWVRIEVDGSNCEISSLAFEQITCTTTAATRTESQTIFEGGAGLKRQVWYDQSTASLDFSSLNAVTPDFTFSVASAQIPRDEDVNIRDKMTGLFRAPATGTYKFFLSSDDYAQVFLGTSADPATAVSVLKFQSYTSLRDQFTKASQSDEISLVENTDYYFEVRHTQGSGSSHLDLGVLISGSTLPNTMPYVQKLQIIPADPVYEVQTLKLFGSSTGPTGGQLRLVYGTTVRDPINWDATSGMWKCSDILNQTSYLGLSGSLSCVGFWASNTSLAYNITFNYLVSDKRYKFSADTSVIEPTNSISITNVKYPGTTTLAGTFKLGFRGAESNWINITTSTAAIEFYLNQQISYFQNQLVVYGTVGFPFNTLLALPWFIFNGTYFDGITVADTNFTGGVIEGSSDPPNINITLDKVYLPTDGAFWPVIPSDFLRTTESAPQIRVFVNKTAVICRGDCSYNYLSYPSFPKIASFSQSSGTLTIVGESFPTDATQISVTVGFSACIDISVSNDATQITCTLQDGVAGSYQPVVKITDQGIIPIDSTFTSTIDSLPTITSISPSSGSTQGGTTVTISGTGFFDSLTNSAYQQYVTIEGAKCTVISTSLTQIKCAAGPQASSSSDVAVTVNGQLATYFSSFYDSSSTPTVTSISPSYASTTFKTEITLQGTLFSSSTSDISVTIGDQVCMVVSSTSTQIVCHLLGGPPGTYTITVSVSPYGIAKFDASITNSFDLKFDVVSISPTSGSVQGGTTLTINGYGFSSVSSSLIITIGNEDHECGNLNVVSSEVITCSTPSYTSDMNLDTAYTVTVIGRVQMESICKGTCSFSWSNSVTPVVSSISPNSGAYGDTITLVGSVFGTDSTKVNLSFGGVEATVTSCSDTEIVATVPAVKGVHPTLALSIDGQGLSDMSSLVFNNNVFVSDVNPKTISQGGEDITISGSGFDTGMAFTFGSVACTVTGITNSQASCKAGPYSAASTAQNLVISGTGSYECSDSSKCSISYSSAFTPILGSSTSGFLTIPFTAPSGNGVVDQTTVQVYLGSYPCTVTSVSASQIVCTPTSPAGTYTISLHVDGYGYSTGSLSSQIALSIANVNASPSSYEGGQSVTLTGTGLSDNLKVYLCGFQCNVETATGDLLTCLSPKIVTTYSQNSFNLANDPTQLSDFTVFSSVSSGAANAFDGNVNTYYRDTTHTYAYVGVDAGLGRYIQLSQVTLIGGGNGNYYYTNLIGTTVQGSNDNSTWDNLYNYTTVTDYTNKWVVPVNNQDSDDYPVYTYRYYRLYQEYAGNNYYINEVSIFGFIGLSETDTDITCDLTTNYPSTSSRLLSGSSSSYASAIQYKGSITPYITDFSPKFGTSLGGDTITFTGSFGASTAVSDVTITIDEVSCSVTSVTSTQIQCTTSPRPNYVSPSLSIAIAGVGYVVTHGKTFLYAERWSAYTTWGGEVPPFEGEAVSIPVGMNILLDIATPHLTLIVIEGGLIVEDVPGLSIDADYIYIQGGLFQIGTEAEPFQNKFTITIHGDRSSALLPYYGSQFIAVRGGVLDIHGVARTPAWTFIDGTIAPDDTTFKVAETVDWAAGEVIAIASTSYDHNESEMMTIASVSGKQITVTSPFVYKHYGVIETYGSDTMDMRAEVGLLTRNILIQAGPEGISQECGVHVMLFAPGDESCIGRIEYAEFYHAGQAYRLGRYPIHFHMIGKVSLSYVRGNSIHHTFNRAITTHGVHYQTLENNVVFRNKGHAYFVEDGIETMNKFIHNLGISTIASFSLLNSDQEPSTFWITNPNNIFLNNHAAGSDKFGYWFEPPENPSGPSATTLICPPYLPLGQFANNTAHSNGKYGFRIWLGHIPLANPCSPGRDKTLRDPFSVNTPVTAYYYNYTGWKNNQDGAIAEDIGDVRFIGFKVADHHKNGIEISYSEFSTPYKTARIHDAVIIGKSGNTDNDVSGAIGLTTPQTDGLLIENVRFYNFDDDMFPLGDESHSDNVQSRDWGGVMHKFSGLTFTNSHKRISWNVPYRGIFHFLDDSYNGVAGSYVTAYWPHLITPECVYEKELYNAISCDSTVAVKRVLFYNLVSDGLFAFQNLNIRRTSGEQLPTEYVEVTVNGTNTTVTEPTWGVLPMTKSCQKKDPLKGWGIPVVTGYNYTLFWGRGYPLDFTQMDIRIEQFDYDEADKWVIISMNFTDHREMFNLTRGTLPSSVNTSASGFVDPTKMKNTTHFNVATDTSGTFYWDNSTDNRRIDILINGVNDNLYQYGPIHLLASRCFGDHCSDLSTTDDSLTNLTVVYWSDPTIWRSGVLPTAGQNVYVLNTWHLMLDIDTPVFHYVEINGLLEFDRTKNVSLSSEWIFVRGGKVKAGSEEYPIPPNIFHTITLHGNPNSEEFAFSNDVEGGNKVFAITGEVQMHGYPKTAYSLLAQNAYPGDSFIFVDSVDWSIGDEIAIAPSGFDKTEDEVFVITDIIGASAQYTIPAMNNSRMLVDFATDPDWQKVNNLRTAGKNPASTDQSLSQQSVPGSSTGITKIVLNGTLKYYHSGVQMLIQGVTVDTRTEVGVLSRNVKIQGDGYIGWGCTSIVSDFYDVLTTSGTPAYRYGRVNMTNVEFSKCGQEDTYKASIRFELGGKIASRVHNSVFRDSYTYAAFFHEANNIEFSSNFMYKTIWKGIVGSDIKNVSITDNVLIKTANRGFLSNTLDVPAGFFICADSPVCSNVSTIGNRVAASDSIAFVLGGQDCDTNVITHYISDNVAHSSDYGYMLSGQNDVTCISANGLKAWFCGQGVGSQGGTMNRFQLSGLVLVENQMGIAMRGQHEDDMVSYINTITDSLLVGRTQQSYCDPNNCISSDCADRGGIVTGVHDIKIIPLSYDEKIILPLSNAKKPECGYGHWEYSDSTFVNFIKTGCGRDYAISGNDQVPNLPQPNLFSKSTFINVDKGSIAYMPSPDKSLIGVGFCGDWVCTGANNNLIQDIDGTITGGSIGGAVIPLVPGIANINICKPYTQGQVYICPYDTASGEVYEYVIIESQDTDKWNRTFSPLNITSVDIGNGYAFKSYNYGAFRNDLNEYEDMTWEAFYRDGLHLSRFGSIIYTGQYYNLTTTGTPPTKFSIITEASIDQSRGFVMTLKYDSPVIVDVYVNGTKVDGIEYNGAATTPVCQLADKTGTNRWFHENNTIQWVQKGHANVTLVQTSSVRLTMELDMTLTEFYTDNTRATLVDKLAAVLGIPSYRIRIASVKQGSVILNMFIRPNDTLVGQTDSTGAKTSDKELASINALVTQLASNGKLTQALGKDVLSVDSQTSIVNDTATTAISTGGTGSTDGGQSTGGNSDGGNTNGGNTDNGGGSTDNGGGSNLIFRGTFNEAVSDWVIGLLVGIILVIMAVGSIFIYAFSKRKRLFLEELPSAKVIPILEEVDEQHAVSFDSPKKEAFEFEAGDVRDMHRIFTKDEEAKQADQEVAYTIEAEERKPARHASLVDV
ncbi:unnamed protein product [Blepharisma stoltei]|uniref:G8 domain-containing protein n=1 Tax=Blepharisma stoltei TaxID=1481888 RepID=A0AAU9IH46_9CILI|nr:unnamed protein product [Blepharisma stoltei]